MAGAKKQTDSKSEEQFEKKDPITQEQEDQSALDEEQGLVLSDEELIDLCKERICSTCPVKDEKDREVLMVRADADNFRKRLAREKEQTCKFAVQDILEDLLPILDNLDLALEHGQKVEACDDLIQGVDMTRKIFLETLKKHGFEMIDSGKGQSFDPAWHEAMGEAEDPDLIPGQIFQVLQKGYKLKDRVLRPAKVMLSK